MKERDVRHILKSTINAAHQETEVKLRRSLNRHIGREHRVDPSPRFTHEGVELTCDPCGIIKVSIAVVDYTWKPA